MTTEEFQSHIAGFNGTEKYTRLGFPFRQHVLTDGALWVAQNGATWLMTDIAACHRKIMAHPDQRLQDIQIWELRKNPAKKTNYPYLLECRADTGEGERPVHTQKYNTISLPVDEFGLYVCRQPVDDNRANDLFVIMLKGEY